MKISLKFAPKGPINNIAAFVQTMAWHRTGNKPLSEPMVVILQITDLDAYLRHPASVSSDFMFNCYLVCFFFIRHGNNRLGTVRHYHENLVQSCDMFVRWWMWAISHVYMISKFLTIFVEHVDGMRVFLTDSDF